MKRWMAAATLVLTGWAGPLAAQEGASTTIGDWFSANVALTSDYAFRGISQTLEEPAIQGGIDLTHPAGFYLGTWGSNVNFGEANLAEGARAQIEMDVYGGFRATLAEIADLDAGAIYYAYPGAGHGRSYDFVEFGLGASRSTGPMSTGLSLKYSPDYFAGSGESVYYGGTLAIPVSFLTLSGSVGRQNIERNEAFGAPDYTDWGLGASVGWSGFALSGKLLGTNLDEDECFGGSEFCETRVVLSVSRGM